MKYVLILCLLVTSGVFAQKPGEAEYNKAMAALGERNFQVWYEESLKAAEKGHAKGCYNVATALDPIFAEKVPFPAEKDAVKAFQYYKKAGDLGDAQAAYETGELYRFGEGTEKDNAKALTYYKKAYELGHTKANVTVYLMLNKDTTAYTAYLADCVNRKYFEAARDLAIIYISGDIVKTNMGTAMKWLEIGEKNNHAGCIYVIGYLYRNGFKKVKEGTITLNQSDADIPKAVEYYKKAAALGNTESMNNLAEMNMLGMEIKQDMPQAFDWFNKSCEAGDGYGCHMCSVMIVNQNVDKPMEEAAVYSRKSLNLGYVPGK
jgi:hypothetical protein